MKRIAALAAVVLSPACLAWDGFDWNQGTYVEIGKGELVRPGQAVEVFDYRQGQYRQMEVQQIDRSATGRTEIQVIDSQTGQPRTFEMDKK